MPSIVSKNFSNLYTGDHYFVIPPYQRSVTWPKDQWNYLLDDIIGLLKKDDPHNHLFQIFQFRSKPTNEGTQYEVGDGQQRLLHSSLFLAGLAFALTDILGDKNISLEDKINIEDIITSILGTCRDGSRKDSLLTLEPKDNKSICPRLILRKAAQEAYQKILCGEIPLLSKNDEFDINDQETSDGALVVLAYQFYGQKLSTYLSPKSFSDISRTAKKIIEVLTKRIVFAIAYFESTEGMQSSYEATNSRGIPLTESELIKNHVFKNFSLPDQEKFSEDWKILDSSDWVSNQVAVSVIKGTAPNFDPTKRSDALDNLFRIHTRAVSGNSSVSKVFSHPIFNNFKEYHDPITANMSTKDTQRYYQGLIKEFISLADTYKEIRDGKYDALADYRGNSVESKQHIYTTARHRLVVGADVSEDDFFTLIFILEMKISGMTGWEEGKIHAKKHEVTAIIREYLRYIESYVIRKVLMGGSVSAAINKVLDLFRKHKTMEPHELYKHLTMQQGRRFCFDGTEEILKKYSSPIPIKESLAKNLNHDYGVLTTKNTKFIRYLEKQTLEHFMPQNSNNYEKEWPLPEGQTIYRDALVGSFGNMLQITDELNRELSNKSYVEKVEMIRKNLAGNKAVDHIVKSDKWESEEITKYCLDKLSVILEYYKGPQKTVGSYPMSVLLSVGKVKVGDIVYCQKRDGSFPVEITVSEDGMLDYQGKSYDTEKALKIAVFGDKVPLNKVDIVVNSGQENIRIRQFIEQIENGVGN